MKHLKPVCIWIVACFLVVALVPAAVAAHDESRRLVLAAVQDDEEDYGNEDDGGDGDFGEENDGGDDGFGEENDGGDDDFSEEDGSEPPVIVDDDDDEDFVPPVVVDDDDDGVVAPPVVIDDDDDGFVPTIDGEDDEDDDDAEDEPRQDQAIVQLVNGVDPDQFANRYGASVLRTIPSPNIVLLSIAFNEEDPNALDTLFSDADVIWGERNFTHQAPEGRVRYFFSGTVGVPRLVNGPALPQGLEYTSDASCVSGDSVSVAVLDTGVDVNHPALSANVLPNGVNMVDLTYDARDDGDGADDDNDGQVDELVGHGTHVSGTILQLAPDAQILPVKVLNSDGVGDAFYVARVSTMRSSKGPT